VKRSSTTLVAASLIRWLVGVTLGQVVHRRGFVEVAGSQGLRADVELASRSDEVDSSGDDLAEVVERDELGVTDQQEGSLGAPGPQRLHGTHDLADLTGSPINGPVQDRDPAVGGDREAGLDPQQVASGVLGMATAGRDEAASVAS
jgi:hypothetical protein